jgi:hypothetical protein
LAESSLYRAYTLGASLLVVGQWGGVEVNVRDSERAFNMIERYVELADEDNEGTMVVKAGIHSQVTDSIGGTVQAQIHRLINPPRTEHALLTPPCLGCLLLTRCSLFHSEF